MSTISARLSLLAQNKQAIKQALESKGVDVKDAPLSQYPQLIDSLAVGFGVGTIANYKTNVNAPGWLEADGSLLRVVDYPDLYALIGETFNTGGEPNGQFRLPDLSPVTYGNITIHPMIKAERDL